MTLHSFDDIDDAVAATRAFLWPFDLGHWAKLAFVVFFLGGTGGASPLQSTGNFPGGPGPRSPTMEIPDLIPSLSGSELTIIATVLAVIVLLVLGFMLVGAVMEFVFVESLRRETVAIRRYWGTRWKQGVRLFGFRLVVGLFSLLVIVGALAAVFGPTMLGGGQFSAGLLVLAVPVIVILAVVSALVNGFTTAFIVPVMIKEERSVLSAWRRFWPTLTTEWKDYAVYAFMRLVLQIAAGILVSILVLLAMLVVAIPLGILAALGFVLFSVAEPVGVAIIAFAGGVFVLCLIIASLFATVPVQTFLHYYALLVLGDTNEALDVIPDQRAAIRE